MKKRVDLLLVEKGLVSSRTKAQDLIRDGKVFVQIFVSGKSEQKKVLLPSEQFENQEFTILKSELDRFVSRAGLKLEGALHFLQLNIQGHRILDVGQSTGGFTDCCLQNGAKDVVGIEVGQDQLVPQLRNDKRVQCFEGINAREMTNALDLGFFDLAVMDLSFISLTLVLPEVTKLTNQVLALVKPQFEVGPEGLGKGGIVKDSSQFQIVENKIKKCVLDLGWKIAAYFPSSIEGKDGNREFFVYLEK